MEEEGEWEAWCSGAVSRVFQPGYTAEADARVDALLDAGSPFLELSSLAGHEVYPDALPGAGLVTGIGTLNVPGFCTISLTPRSGGRTKVYDRRE